MQNRLTRHPERGSTARAGLDALLDTQCWGVLATVHDGLPWAVPMLHARAGDRLLLHGSTGAGALRQVAAGAPVVYTVTVLDALVVGYTTFSSSANYRSATVRGALCELAGEEKAAALDVFSGTLFPGRVAEVRPMNAKELAATTALELPIVEDGWLYKARTGGPSVPGEPTDVWGGVVPINADFGEPERADWSQAPLPPSITRLVAGDS